MAQCIQRLSASLDGDQFPSFWTMTPESKSSTTFSNCHSDVLTGLDGKIKRVLLEPEVAQLVMSLSSIGGHMEKKPPKFLQLEWLDSKVVGRIGGVSYRLSSLSRRVFMLITLCFFCSSCIHW